MSTGECEKIIDQVTDPRNLNDQCRQHIKTCKECAAVVACMTWARAKGSPTADMKPSQAFLGRIEQALDSGPISGGGAACGTGSNLLAWVFGIGLAAALLFGVVSTYDRPPGNTTANGFTSSNGTSTTVSPAESESRILKTQQTAPVLKFPSPADDVE